MLLFDAMRRADEIKPDLIRGALAATKDFQGVTGTMTLDENRNPNEPIVVIEVKDKKFRFAAQLLAN